MTQKNSNKNKSVLFAGAYGIENAGDDLPMLVLMRELNSIAPYFKFSFSALSRHPNQWERDRYDVQFVQNLEYETKAQSAGKWFRGLNPGDKMTPLLEVRRAIEKADLLVIGSGNFLNDTSIDVFRGPIPLAAVYVFLAESVGTPVMLYGVSAGPLRTEWGQTLAKWILEKARVVTVRDEDSASLLRTQLSVRREFQILPDPVLGASLQNLDLGTLFQKYNLPSQITKDAKVLAVALRDLTVSLPEQSAEAAYDEIAAFLMELQQTAILFVPQSTYTADDDRETARKIIRRLPKGFPCYSIEKRMHPEHLIAVYSGCHTTLAVRLHGAVFSTVGQTPVLGIAYHQKVRSFMNWADQSEFCIDLQSISRKTLSEKYEAIEKKYVEIQKSLNNKMDSARKFVHEYGRLALQILEDK